MALMAAPPEALAPNRIMQAATVAHHTLGF